MAGARRIVALTEETTETLYLLGRQDRLVGITRFTKRPPEARAEKPIVSAFTKADVGKVVDLEPDLVIGFSDVQADLAAELVRVGLDVWITNQRSLTEILDVIRLLGRIVDAADDADALADRLAGRVDEARRATAGRDHRPRVFFEEWDDPLISGITWVSELVEAAGGDDLFAAETRREPKAEGRVVDPAEVAARDPEIILASWCGKKLQRDVIEGRPGWETVTAIVEGRIHELPAEDILQPGPAAFTAGLDHLRRLLG
ncbi:MAG: helical backbone metal receptor [Acidimicrobiia bacterium]